MSIFEDRIKGECKEMCPVKEMKMRERERLLHVLEMVPGTEKSKHPKADKNKIVKCFSRSAAGKHMEDKYNLRPPDVLLKTVKYLLSDVINVDHLPWNVVYDFIMDRLRSVRQDAAIQEVSVIDSILLFQPIVRFYAYSAYRLCNESIHNFDPHINKTHLQECLKKLLCFYDECDRVQLDIMEDLMKIRPNIEGLYIILNLGDLDPLRRFLTLPPKWRTDVVQKCFEASVNYIYRNFVRTCRIIKKLSPLLAAVAALHLPKLRRNWFEVMSVAYYSKNLIYSLEDLRILLLYGNNQELEKDLKHFGFIVDDNGVYFLKKGIEKESKELPPRHEEFVEEKLKKKSLKSMILYGE